MLKFMTSILDVFLVSRRLIDRNAYSKLIKFRLVAFDRATTIVPYAKSFEH